MAIVAKKGQKKTSQSQSHFFFDFCNYLSTSCTCFCLNWNVFLVCRCHGPIPPPNPEFTVKPKKKKTGRIIEATPGSTCPPCKEIVLLSCFGQHLGQERPVWQCNAYFSTYYISSIRCHFIIGSKELTLELPIFGQFKMVCVSKRQFSCENLCGNPLPCGNHYCTKPCHVLETQTGSTHAEPCEECTLPCKKVNLSSFISYPIL